MVLVIVHVVIGISKYQILMTLSSILLNPVSYIREGKQNSIIYGKKLILEINTFLLRHQGGKLIYGIIKKNRN